MILLEERRWYSPERFGYGGNGQADGGGFDYHETYDVRNDGNGCGDGPTGDGVGDSWESDHDEMTFEHLVTNAALRVTYGSS